MNMDINQLFKVNKLTLAVSLLSIAAILATYWPMLVPLHLRWTAFNEAYSHGYMVAAMSGYGIAGQLLKNKAESSFSYSALLLALLVSAVWFAGFAVQVQLVQQLMFPAIVGAWLLAVFGRELVIKCLPAISFLYLVIPLWGFLIDPLRQVTVNVVQYGLEYLSIPALIDGYRISLPSGVLEVAGGCSGLNYLLVSLVVGTYFSYTSVVSLQRRLVIIAIAIAIALVGNWVRVFILVLVGHYSEMQNDLVYNHGFFGWGVYCVFLIGFFVVSTALVNNSPQVAEPALEAESEPEKKQGMVNRVQLLSITLVTAVLIAAPLWGRYQTSASVLQSDLNVSFSGFSFVDITPESNVWLAGYKGYDSAQSTNVITSGRQYELTLLTYLEQRQGKELIYYRNVLADERFIDSQSPVVLREGQALNQAIVKTPGDGRIVWWGYRVAGYYTASPLMAKALQLPALLRGGSVASLVTLSTECGSVNCVKLLEDLNQQGEHLVLLSRLTAEK